MQNEHRARTIDQREPAFARRERRLVRAHRAPSRTRLRETKGNSAKRALPGHDNSCVARISSPSETRPQGEALGLHAHLPVLAHGLGHERAAATTKLGEVRHSMSSPKKCASIRLRSLSLLDERGVKCEVRARFRLSPAVACPTPCPPSIERHVRPHQRNHSQKQQPTRTRWAASLIMLTLSVYLFTFRSSSASRTLSGHGTRDIFFLFFLFHGRALGRSESSLVRREPKLLARARVRPGLYV